MAAALPAPPAKARRAGHSDLFAAASRIASRAARLLKASLIVPPTGLNSLNMSASPPTSTAPESRPYRDAAF